jgi:outer membrane protein OmpA-like peptidoglycan-associated protein
MRRAALYWLWFGCTPSNTAANVTIEPLPTPPAHVAIASPEGDIRVDRNGQLEIAMPTFETGKATLRPESEAVLMSVVRFMRGRRDGLRIEVHTDSMGSSA